MSREIVDEGYVLHARPYRETSLLVEAFTIEHGRLGLVARGARRGKGAMAMRLQPFHRLFLRWGPKGEIHTLYAAEELQRHLVPVGHLTAALYLNELLMRLTIRHDPQPMLQMAYVTALEALEKTAVLEPVLREFELDLLAGIGYGLDFQHEAHGRVVIEAEQRYRLIEDHGFVPASDAAGPVYPGWILQAISERDWQQSEVLAAAKRVLRQALDSRLGDRPLQTRRLLAGFARLKKLKHRIEI